MVTAHGIIIVERQMKNRTSRPQARMRAKP